MTPSTLVRLSLACALVVVIGLSVVMTGGPGRQAKNLGTNPLGATGLMAHRLFSFDTPEVLATTRPAGDGFPLVTHVNTPPTTVPGGFVELLPSWNVLVPEGTGARFDVRVRDAKTGTLSPWLYCGRWGRTPEETKVARFDRGRVDVDILLLDRPADAFELRASLYSYDPAGSVSASLRRMTVVCSSPSDQKPVVALVGDWKRDLPVPFRAQGVEPDSIRSDICSPTSTSMVMDYFGVDRPTRDNAVAIYDDEHDLFGNWSRATQRAGELGLDSHLTRIASIDEARNFIAAGQPLIASIRFSAGEFPSNVMKSTSGHLVVVRGFTDTGDAIVNDPASKDRGNAVVYKADELERAWITNAGGVTYVIRR
jgi:hypothetical protein